jgi:hypothetical protein
MLFAQERVSQESGVLLLHLDLRYCTVINADYRKTQKKHNNYKKVVKKL